MICGGNAIWNKYVLSFVFSEDSYSFRCFQSDRKLIPDPIRSDRECYQPDDITNVAGTRYVMWLVTLE